MSYPYLNDGANDLTTVRSDVSVVKEVLYAKAAPYNILGNNTDETTKLQTYFAALQGALGKPEGELGPGIFRTTAKIDLGVYALTLSGAGRGSNIGECTRIVNDVSDVFEITGGSGYWNIKDLAIEASAGHIFKQSQDLSQSSFENVRCNQGATDKSIWDNQTSKTYIDVKWENFEFQHVLAATVPGFRLNDPAAGNHNRNTWEQGRCTNSGVPFFDFRAESASAYVYDNVLRDINFEICNGGCLKAHTAQGFSLENLSVYDLTAATSADLFYFGAGGGGLKSYAGFMKNVRRLGGSLGIAATGTGDITNTSPTVLNVTGLTSADIGRPITGSNIPSNTTVVNLVGSTLTLSANATATTAGLALTTTFCDIRLASASKAGNFLLMNVGAATGSGFAVDLGSNPAVLINDTINKLGGVSTNLIRLPASSFAKVNVPQLAIGNSVAATEVIGKAVVKKIEVFDHLGVSLGFVPVYATIT